MDKPKYVAEGFEEDVIELLKEFTKESSIKFLDFAKVWKKNHFSLVFMGRPDQVETAEFTNEIYRICMQYLSSPSFIKRVGTVYILYALYRNQIAEPPVKIRIELSQWKTVKDLHLEARTKQLKTLHYVIDYLIKNSFIFVANQTLKGPLTGSMHKITKSSEEISNLNAVYKSDMIEYSVRNNLQVLRDLHYQYFENKKSVDSDVKVSLTKDYEVYDTFLSDVKELVNPSSSQKKGSENLGSRRAKIKAQSFLRRTKDRFGQTIEEDNEEENIDNPDSDEVRPKKKSTRNRRVPKHRRRVGRPSKKPKIEVPVEEKSDDDNIDITHLIDQQNDFYLPPEEDCKKIKTKSGRYYYKLSPKREGCASSDPDDC